MAVTLTNTVRAGQFFKPIGGVIPSGVLSSDAFNAAAQTYTNPATILWDSGQFNTQGQQWEAVSGTSSDGCRNAATPRTDVSHVIEFEFLFTGLAFDIAFIGSSYYDMQVYVEYGGKMYKAKVDPLSGTTTGLMHRRITFASAYHGRIRVHLGGAAFVGIKCEQSAIIKPSPSRVFAICEGGGWGDSVKQASGTSFLTAGLCDFLFELTGIAWARRAQANTGYFRNGTATVTDDTANASGASRFFSAGRKAKLDFTDKPLFVLVVGSHADGGNSGATGASNGPMATRALNCYQWIRAQDPHCTIVQVSPEPFTGAGAAGTVTGPPTAANGHDLNRQEQLSALAGVSRAASINSFGPTTPWWSGTGGNGTPTTSQQAGIVGADGFHPSALGYLFYASKIAATLAQTLVFGPRARRQV